MDTALKTAVEDVLTHIIIRPDDTDKGLDRLEYARLRDLRSKGLMRPLAARLAILTTLGWKRTAVAEAMDVSRVTLNNWLRDHTSGADTFKPYGSDAIEGDPDSVARDDVNAPVTNKLTARNAEELGGVRFEHDKFVVPEGFKRPLAALWRVAYKARGHDLTTDPEIAAAGDALDVLISVLLRRGVTNLAIANAAGVTHRAVLDRMNRARHRGLVLVCGGDDCESFYGEAVVRRVIAHNDFSSYDASEWSNHSGLENPGLLAGIRITSSRPARYWLQTMVDTEVDGHPAVVLPPRGDEHVGWHTRLHCAKFACFDDHRVSTAYDELTLTALLGRMNEASFDSNTVSKRMRNGIMFVSAEFLYTESMERRGMLPSTSGQAVKHMPPKLWDTYFEPYDTVKRCFTNPAEVESEFEPTAKHKSDAKTRRENS